MQAFKDDQQIYYRKMLELQEKLRKSEEERIRLEERFNFLIQDSRIRHQSCINRLRIRYVEFLEEQRMRDERNNKLLGSLHKVDSSLAIMSAKTERLNVLRKHYEAYLIRVYGHDRSSAAFGIAKSGSNDGASQGHTLPAFNSLVASNYKKNTTQESSANNNSYAQQSRHFNLRSSTPRKYAATTTTTKDDDNGSQRGVAVGEPTGLPTPQAGRALWNKYLSLPSDSEDEKLQAKLETETALLNSFGSSLASKLLEPDLDSYIGKLKQLHVEEKKTPEIFRDRSSLDDFDQEQNTSGDLLNVTLAEEQERTLASPTGFRKGARLERTRDAPNVEMLDYQRPRQAATTFVQEAEEERFGGAEIEDDYDESVDIDSWMPDDQDVEDQPVQELHPRDSLRTRPRRKLEAIEEVEQAEDELAELESNSHLRIAAQQSSAADNQVTGGRSIVQGEAAEAARQPEHTTYESQQASDVELHEQTQLEETQQYHVETAATSHLEYQQQEQPGYTYDQSNYQHAGADHENYHDPQQQQQQCLYETGRATTSDGQYLEEHATASNYDQQQPGEEQNYEQISSGDYYQGGYDNATATDNGLQQHEQAFVDNEIEATNEGQEYAQQIDISHYSETSVQQQFEPISVEAKLQTEKGEDAHSDSGSRQQRLSTANKRKKDPIKSILDSDSDSLIERKLSNSESDFDFN